MSGKPNLTEQEYVEINEDGKVSNINMFPDVITAEEYAKIKAAKEAMKNNEEKE